MSVRLACQHKRKVNYFLFLSNLLSQFAMFIAASPLIFSFNIYFENYVHIEYYNIY